MINFDVQIRDFPFNEQSQGTIELWHNGEHAYGKNWPVVYFIHNDTEAYIGETLNAGKRASQHWQVDERKKLKMIHIMTDETFNKSVILDLESFLIKYVSADGKFKLQNGNAGLTNFEYYSRNEYIHEFKKVWDKLKESGLVRSGIADIEDSDLYKYSPYKSLTEDQHAVLEQILYILAGYLSLGLKDTIVVEGGAGTGKTILAVFLMKLLADLKAGITSEDEPEVESAVWKLDKLIGPDKPLKIGFVVPQQSLRQTLKKVFGTIRGLSENMIYTPREAAKEGKSKPFDLLICDEAHRLRRRAALSQYPAYDSINEELGLSKDKTELDWIMKVSNMQLLFYDSDQSVRPSDIPQELFDGILGHCRKLSLTSQLRCLGGDDYIQYVKEVLNVSGFPGLKQTGSESITMREGGGSPFGFIQPHGEFKDYTLRMYDDLDQMMDEINHLNQEYNLCCAVAGYAWEWITKGKPKDTPLRDIQIGRGYIWNRTDTDWINSGRLPYEIGCIHTVQGYDLNYVGVIFGPEITFNKDTGRIEVIKENYKDSLGKAVSGDYEALREYIINIYATLLTRGIHGALVYVCDPELRKYLKTYFDVK